VHQFYDGTVKNDDARAIAQHRVADLIEYILSMGIDIETMNIAFRTLSQDMHVFSKYELRRFNIVTDKPSPENNCKEYKPDAFLWRQDGWEVKMEYFSEWALSDNETIPRYCTMEKKTHAGNVIGFSDRNKGSSVSITLHGIPPIFSRLLKETPKILSSALQYLPK